MWVLRGVLLGVGIFTVAEILYLYLGLFRPIARATHTWAFAVSIGILKGHTIDNAMFWVALAACLMLGCALFGQRNFVLASMRSM
jgi:hypothetical protein